jgi:uncharacterized protein YaiI (UPF0178 family)
MVSFAKTNIRYQATKRQFVKESRKTGKKREKNMEK